MEGIAGGAALPVSQGLLVGATDVRMLGCTPAEPPQAEELGMEMVPLLECRYPGGFQLAKEALGEPAVSGPRLRPLLR